MLKPEELPVWAKKSEAANKKLLDRIKKKKPSDLDATVHRLHDAAFEEMDCLTCANCCKTISPTVTQRDIERLSKHFRIRPAQVIEQYLYLDEEQDYVMQRTPCPFLGADNYCSVYEARPDACREYPHTDRRKFYQITGITLKNTAVCPAVYHIVEQLQQHY